MEVDTAFGLISHAIDAGRAAHGYLVTGDVGGNCSELVSRILGKLFPDEESMVASGSHPDIVSLWPSGKSRTIKVAKTDTDPAPGMRDAIIEPMSATAFSGGWKVGIVYCADRMQPAAANAFLKSLEEPTPMTMYLLLTDQPDSILPTIISRTQRIDLPLPSGVLDNDDMDGVAEALVAKDSSRLAAKLGALKDDASAEDVALVRKRFFKTLMSIVRRYMLDGSLPRHLAFRNVEAVETAYRRSEKSMSDGAVLSWLVDTLAFPPNA